MGKSTTNNTTDSKQGEARPPCDYRNKECAAYGYTIGSRWVCTKHVCEQLQQCWLNARTPRASLAAPEGDAWLDIETAPRDGTAILVYGSELLREVDGHCAVVRWQTNENSTIPWWTISDGKFGPYDLRGPSPTHWRPLPISPNPAASSPLPAEPPPTCERCADDANYEPAGLDKHTNLWLHRGRTGEGYICRLKHPNGLAAPAEPRQEGEQEIRLLPAEALIDIERFQRQRRKNPVPTDAWLYVAEIDQLLAHVAYLTARWCVCGHSKSDHQFYADHDECWKCPATEPPESCSEFRAVATPPETPVVASAIAGEIVHLVQDEYEHGAASIEPKIAAIITRYLVGTPLPETNVRTNVEGEK